MSIIKTIVAGTCAILALVALSQVKGWRGIVPLHATRTDVERLLGSPTKSHGVAFTYDTAKERVLIFYSAGPCKKGVSDEWNVSPDTVVSISVYPKTKLLVAELGMDKAKYERLGDPHVAGTVHYTNEDEGVRIDASIAEGESEEVNSMTYTPTPRDNYLRCSGSSVGSNGDKNFPPPRKFDEYSNIPFSDEKARLDNFAIYLQKDEPAFKGYIIVYAARSTRSGAAQARAKRAKDYLVKVRGIETARVVTIDGGYRDQLEVELYALPAAMLPPTPNPYRRD